MTQEQTRQGQHELASVRRRSRGLFWATGVFSVCVNLLMLTGPLFMLQVYDRVLGSGSEATLVALFVIVAFLYLMMGLLDGIRGRVLSRIAARFQSDLETRVFPCAAFSARRRFPPSTICRLRRCSFWASDCFTPTSAYWPSAAARFWSLSPYCIAPLPNRHRALPFSPKQRPRKWPAG